MAIFGVEGDRLLERIGGLTTSPPQLLNVGLLAPEIQNKKEILTAKNSEIKIDAKEQNQQPIKASVNERASSVINLVLQQYAKELRERIHQNLSFPTYLRRKEVSAKPRIQFDIGKDGSLLNVILVKGSGFPTIDKLVLNAIKKAAPFPPIPNEIKKEELSLELPLLFHVK